MNKKYSLICVDLQNDLASEGGKLYSSKPSLTFLKNILLPYLESANVKVSEIVSDYRLPRPGYTKGCCQPGEWGYESIIPEKIKKSQWLKSMNSPVWIRDNIGEAHKKPGLPRSDPEKFTPWLEDSVGMPGEVIPVVFGLTVDCCVLCVAQELFWRGYETLILKEGVDCPSGKAEDRDTVLQTTVSNWAKAVDWQQLKSVLEMD
jgi:nicotinamidase-related amidase